MAMIIIVSTILVCSLSLSRSQLVSEKGEEGVFSRFKVALYKYHGPKPLCGSLDLPRNAAFA